MKHKKKHENDILLIILLHDCTYDSISIQVNMSEIWGKGLQRSYLLKITFLLSREYFRVLYYWLV